ncbi:AraC family transcriptional regulator [Kitasatospora sp. NPDC059646]|uniref:AraC family transcriptional regulator n=1 Tax=Kitasatospora sp. NPDC059646 TaxID=3346893 RepID=UPI0036BA305E
MRRHRLGRVTVTVTTFPRTGAHRGGPTGRDDDEELCHLSLLTAGGGRVQGAGRDGAEEFGPGDIHLTTSSDPADGQFFGFADGAAGQRPAEGVGLDVPVALLQVPPHRMRDLTGRRLSGREGTGALLTALLVGLDRQAAALQPAEACRLGNVVVDLVSTWLSGLLDAEADVSQEDRQRALVESSKEFIRQNLHDPGLTPPVVAAAHHISVSHLHSLFARHSEGETVAAFIRARRMDKARRELADPALRTLPIYRIAARCGIPRAPEFTRAFKAAHGLSPREYRSRELARAAAPQG